MAHSVLIPLPAYQGHSVEEMKRRAAQFYADIRRRRTVREFSDRPVPREVIEDCLRAAGTAPNGANMRLIAKDGHERFLPGAFTAKSK
jgi:iodotyrosine deiodinase